MSAAISPTCSRELKPDVCFNALHGRWGEDGCVQGLLEVLRHPLYALGRAGLRHRHAQGARPRSIVAARRRAGGRGAEVVTPREALRRPRAAAALCGKPIAEGSSVGVVIVAAGANRAAGRDRDHSGHRRRPDHGRALHPGPRADLRRRSAAAPTEIIDIVAADHLAFYDYEAKYAPGGSKHILPAEISRHVDAARPGAHAGGPSRRSAAAASRAPISAGTRPTDELIFLEINTQPGMTPTSLVPELAAHAGLSFGKLVAWMVEDASGNR